MLKTNSKKARQNLQAYIMDNFTPENYLGYDFETAPEGIKDISTAIMHIFYDEYIKYDRRPLNYQEAFVDYTRGLPSIIDTCYWYNRSAVDDLGAILEETEQEKARYTEDQAGELLSRLMYMELLKNSEFSF